MNEVIVRLHAYTPAHGSKYSTKRFRYYVSNKKMQRMEDTSSAMGNLPAQDVENIVVEALKGLLLNEEKVSWLGDSPGDKQHLVDKATARHEEMNRVSPGDIYTLVRTLVGRVVIHENKVEVRVRMDTLKPYLLKGHAPLPDNKVPANQTIDVEVPVTLRRFRQSMRIVADGDAYGNPVPQPNPTICKALARAFMWNEMLVKGEVTSIKEIAALENVDDHYVRKILRPAYLSPDIAKALLRGEYPRATADKLVAVKTVNWQNQLSAILAD